MHARTIMGGAPHQGGTLHHMGPCGGGEPYMLPLPVPLLPGPAGACMPMV